MKDGKPDPAEIEACRTAQEFAQAAARFASSLPKRKGLSAIKLTVIAEDLPQRLACCHGAANAEAFAEAVKLAIRSRRQCHSILERFRAIRLGNVPDRLVAEELLERVEEALRALRSQRQGQ